MHTSTVFTPFLGNYFSVPQDVLVLLLYVFFHNVFYDIGDYVKNRDRNHYIDNDGFHEILGVEMCLMLFLYGGF
jgi:hypothetical protein